MTSDKRDFYFKSAAAAYRDANGKHWRFAFMAAKVVGQYEMGATVSLAKEMSVERSTVENHAHAWQMFYDLVCLSPEASRFVRTVRTVPFIYYTHFLKLWELRNSFRLSNEQCLDLLHTLWQGEGEFSAGAIEQLAKERFGDTRDWTFYAQKVQKNLSELLKQPDLPQEGKEKIVDVYNWLGDHA